MSAVKGQAFILCLNNSGIKYCLWRISHIIWLIQTHEDYLHFSKPWTFGYVFPHTRGPISKPPFSLTKGGDILKAPTSSSSEARAFSYQAVICSGAGKSCSPGHIVFMYSLVCGGKCSLGHWHPLFLHCSRGSIIHAQALVISLGLMCNYSRCHSWSMIGTEAVRTPQCSRSWGTLYSHPSRQRLLAFSFSFPTYLTLWG